MPCARVCRRLGKARSSLEKIRDLRNRIFHHESIIHWKDLDDQHDLILEIIGWVSPNMREMALMLDRYRRIRSEGLRPWIERISQNWPTATFRINPVSTPIHKTKAP
jgi:hypothetical protein